MKKLLITGAATVGIALGAFAQGSVAIENADISALYGVSLNSEGSYFDGTLTIQVWYLNGTNANGAINAGNGGANGNLGGYNAMVNAGFTLAHSYSGVTMVSGVSDGTFNLGALNIPGVTPAGANVDLALVAFTGASYSTLGSDSGVINFLQPTANYLVTPPPTPPNLTVGWNTFGSDLIMTQVIPEPGTFALAGLGAAALLIFRRRK